MQLLAGGLMQLLLAVVTGEAAAFDLAQVSPLSLGAMVYLAIVSSIIAFTAFSWLMRVSTPARVSTYAFVNPVVAVFLGWALNGEALQPTTLIAAAVIILAVVLITRGRTQRQAKPSHVIETPELVKGVEAA
jgi:drug/metabolite transporter (DMT)-like permease